MAYLLDTHALLWSLTNAPHFSQEAKNVITDGHNIIYVSAVNTWEITIKKNLGKLKSPDNLEEEIKKHYFTELPVTISHTQILANLPNIHSDPFDRLLIAQAKAENLTLITRDTQIAKYAIPILPA